MERSLLSFVKAIGEDQHLRKMYRADPVKTLDNYGISNISYSEFFSDETQKAFTDLPDRNPEDGLAYTKLMMQMALYPNGWR